MSLSCGADNGGVGALDDRWPLDRHRAMPECCVWTS